MVSSRRVLMRRISPSSVSLARSSSCIMGNTRSPAAVSRMPVRLRTSRAKPMSFSRLFIIWVSPDWVYPSVSAARVKLPMRTAMASASSFFVSIRRPPFP